MSDRDRVLSKIEKTETCWLWTGSLNAKGYGQVGINYKTLLAHRVVYELLVGPIPEGLVIDHLCRVTRCVNPAHLEPVTNRENILRGIGPTAVAARRDICVRGHPYSPENTRVDRFGVRRCRECGRDNQFRYAETRREQLAQYQRDRRSQNA